ncbi:MAP kinase 19 [Actinidia rufa]|uniref:MAP kinase 19 n=1 Tax=Actinidia rufa TaxID=165716 RepID=A0A7J0DJA3_9ERIC|nr:MAP kinase 19 [Actinidia rufa]
MFVLHTILGNFLSPHFYTPAIDIWSIGCIFAEVLTGKPLFPGKSVVHQLDLITELLGTPSADTISGVRNEKARRYLTNMRKKQPVSFDAKFPSADPSALRLLQRLLAFDPKDRPTAEEALTDPYFKGIAKVEREPSCQPISKIEFEFERRRVTKEDIRELLFREILEYNPQLLKDYMAGNEGANFLYPSATGQFKKHFAYLEENDGKSGPVIPPERKHVSLPRSTVNSSIVPPRTNPNLASFHSQQVTEEACNSVRVVTDAMSGNFVKPSRPPPRVPAAKPGRVVGPVLPYESGRNISAAYDPRLFLRNRTIPPQGISPHYVTRTNTVNQEKSGRTNTVNQEMSGPERNRDSAQIRSLPAQCNTAAKPAPQLAIDMNTNLYYQQQVKASQLNDQIAINAKLLQEQSQLGAIGTAAVVVAARREVGTVQFGSS